MQHGVDAAARASAEQAEVVAFLSNPATFGRCSTVERHETHGAIVFLAGALAYKLKRALKYPYMDYSTPDRRRAMCEAELAINQRAAPELYRTVRPIVRDGNGSLRFGEQGETNAAVDWVVVMCRFRQSDLLRQMCGQGQLTEKLIKTVAEIVANFHQHAETRRDFGGASGIMRVIEENAAVLQSFAGRPFASATIDRFDSGVRDAFHSVASLLEERRIDGLVRRCHGDLHLNNICMFRGKPVLFDAIEFSEDFSCIDVLYDVALLLMDLEFRNQRPLANVLLNRYLETTGDYGGLAALPLFLACRAAMRAHVAAAAAQFANGDADHAAQADRLLHQAIGYLQPVKLRLVVTGGYSGSGKSTLARALAPEIGRAPGAVILRSDVVRKQQFQADELTRLPPHAYSAEATVQVYAAVAKHAATILAAGHSVIADAAYGLSHEREAIEGVVRKAGAVFCPLWLEAPMDVLKQRLDRRQQDVSDATVDILYRQMEWFERPASWQVVDSSGSLDDMLLGVRKIVHDTEGLSITAPVSGSTQTR